MSLLRDLAAEDDSHRRDYATLADAAEVALWLSARHADAPLAVTLGCDERLLGLSYRVGEGRAVPVALIEASARGSRSAGPCQDRARRQGCAAGFHAAGIEPADVTHDVMLYAFLSAPTRAVVRPKLWPSGFSTAS